MMYLKINFTLLTIICISIFGSGKTHAGIMNPFDAALIKAGYGGTYIYFQTPRYPFVAIVDQFNIGIDLQTPKGVDLSVGYTLPGLFQSRNFQQLNISSYNLNLKYRPLRKWYNQPYLAGGFTYLNYFFDEYGNKYEGNSLNLNLSIGLNIQFPGNFYLVADVKNIFGSYKNNPIPIANTIFLNGSLGYRIHKASTKTPEN